MLFYKAFGSIEMHNARAVVDVHVPRAGERSVLVRYDLELLGVVV
ncbi:MAG: hypothetical protein OEZ06_27315 [Myxococcales bacterium]|nr:hypothetical protein [Myxococcales bacterium]